MELEEAARCPITGSEPPDWLDDEVDIQRFYALRDLLLSVSDQMCTALDVDQLARYVTAEREYVTYSKKLRKALKGDGTDAAGKIQRQQNIAFNQVQQCASALGLNIASRLKIDLRKPKEEKANPFAAFEK